MSTGIIEIIKVAAMDAVENSKPCDLRFGIVSSIAPLKVKVSNDLIIPESLLIVPEHLTDYSVLSNAGGEGTNEGGSSVDLSVEGETLFITTNTTNTVAESTETTDDAVEFVDERTLTIYNGLEVGDNVVLLRNQGGSSYLILDRV